MNHGTSDDAEEALRYFARRDAALAAVVIVGQELDCWVNSLGAVAAISLDSQVLGVKPDEFEVIAYHDSAAARTNEGF